uniref:Uncharacterized protein n=1 Tax=Oryza meridionalis TaxID=40149 RepID=A0A0E0F2W4_9ORYZ
MWAPWSVGPACQRETSCSARPNIEAEKEAEAEAEADCLLAGVQFSRRIPSLQINSIQDRGVLFLTMNAEVKSKCGGLASQMAM